MPAKQITTAVEDIDLAEYVPLTVAARRLPKCRNNKPTHVSTLHRWGTVGIRGVKLEIYQVGGTKCTTNAALSRFFSRLSGDPSPKPRSAASRDASMLKAEAELKAAGI